MKCFPIALALGFLSAAAFAEESGHGEHAEKKPPPKPPAGSPVSEVLKLPVVVAWSKWVGSYKSSMLNAWGESINTVEGRKCWGVAVGEIFPGGRVRIWKRFCVPIDGAEIWVEGKTPEPDATIAYKPYGKWVTECKPTEKFEGNC